MNNDFSVSRLVAYRQLKALFSGGRHRSYKKAQYILHAQEEPMGVFMLKSGWVKSITIDSDGDEQINYIHFPGDVFPVLWAINNVTQDNFYVACSPVEVDIISGQALNDYLDTHPRKALQLLKDIVRGEQWFRNHIENLELKDAGRRMAYFFLDMYNRNRSIGNIKHGNSIHIAPIHLNHQDIANYLNMARETATKKIHELTKDNIISLKHRELIIYDLDKLRLLTE